MNKSMLIMLLLTTVILCTTPSYTYQNQTTFQKIISFFNAQQFTSIYQLITPKYIMGDESQQIMDETDSQYDEDMQSYAKQLTKIFKEKGPIAYKIIPNNYTNNSNSYSYYSEDYSSDESTNTYDGTVVYNNSLSIDQLSVVVDEGEISDINFGSRYSYSGSILPSANNKRNYNISLAILNNGVDSIGVNEKFRMAGQQRYIPIMIIALEFARQVDAKIIVPTTMIDRENIKKYHIPHYDTMLFDFLYSKSYQEGYNNSVSLQNIAIGMVQYQSPGLAEYLQSYLGFWNIDKMRKQIGMKQLNPYHLASFMVAFSNYQNLTTKDYATSISGMNSKSLYLQQLSIHHTLRARNKTSWKTLKQTNAYLNSKIVQASINKLSVKYTTLQYVTLYNNINNSSMLAPKVAKLFYDIIQPKQVNYFGWNVERYQMAMGTNKLKKAINGVSQISYALFIHGEFYQFRQIVPVLQQFILNDPVFCQDLALRLTNEKASKKKH